MDQENEYIVEIPQVPHQKKQTFQVDVLNQLISHKMKTEYHNKKGKNLDELVKKIKSFEQVKNLQQQIKNAGTNRVKKLKIPDHQTRASSELGVYGE